MKKIYYNKQLLIEGIIVVCVCVLLAVSMAIWLLVDTSATKTEFDRYGCAILFFSMAFAMLLCGIFCYPIWSSFYIIDKETFQIKNRRIKVLVSAEFYHYVYYGYLAEYKSFILV